MTDIIGVTQGLRDQVPHNRWLGLEPIEVTQNQVRFSFHATVDHLNHIDDSTIHPSVIGSVLDAVMGLCAGWSIGKVESFATLNLRVDHLNPAPLGSYEVWANTHSLDDLLVRVSGELRSSSGMVFTQAVGVFARRGKK